MSSSILNVTALHNGTLSGMSSGGAFVDSGQAIVGLLIFVAACLSLLFTLMIVIFRPCSLKGGSMRCKMCGICCVFIQYVMLKIYKCCWCRCCKRGQRYIVKRAGSLQQQMEMELQQWDDAVSSSEEEEEERDQYNI